MRTPNGPVGDYMSMADRIREHAKRLAAEADDLENWKQYSPAVAEELRPEDPATVDVAMVNVLFGDIGQVTRSAHDVDQSPARSSARDVDYATVAANTLADEVGANQALKRVLQVYWPHLIQTRSVRRRMITVTGMGGRAMGVGLMLNGHIVLSDTRLYEVLPVNRRAAMVQGELDPLFMDGSDARQLMEILFLFDLKTGLGLIGSIT